MSNKFDVTPEVFAELLGISIDELPDLSIKHINNSNFKYKPVINDEREKIKSEVVDIINSDSLSVVGPQRQNIWEKGWGENLQNFIEHNYDPEELYPKYIRPDRPIRFKKEYIIPVLVFLSEITFSLFIVDFILYNIERSLDFIVSSFFPFCILIEPSAKMYPRIYAIGLLHFLKKSRLIE